MSVFNFVKAGGKKFFSKKSPTITSVKPGTGLTTKRAIQDKTVKAVDEGTKKGMKEAGADSKFLTSDQKRKINQKKSKMKKDESKKLKGVSYEYDRLTKKFAKTKANIEKKKKIKTAAGATAVGSGTVAAGLAFKKIKEKRDKKMGGGMMGRRMGYSQGSNGKPVSRSKNPGLLKMSKSEKGKAVIKKFGYNPNRIVAKKGGRS
jgi:hypothetical protein